MNRTKYLKGACQHCAGHLEFPAEMVGLPIPCPHCGQQTELLLVVPPEESAIPRKALLWTFSAMVVLGLGFGGALIALKRAQRLAERQSQPAPTTMLPAERATSQTEGDPKKESAAENGFVVSEIKLEKNAGSSLVYALGTAKNSSKKQRFGVKIEIDLFDGANQKVSTATDYRQVLDSEEQWAFKALVIDSKAISAQLKSIKEEQ